MNILELSEQEIGLAHGSTDHGTTVTVQTNIHCGVTSQKLTAPFLKGFRHTRRSFEGSGGAVPLDNCVFHAISSLFPAVTQIDISESGNRPVNFGIQLGFHFGQCQINEVQQIFDVVCRGIGELV